jgi:hypothetical protein
MLCSCRTLKKWVRPEDMHVFLNGE